MTSALNVAAYAACMLIGIAGLVRALAGRENNVAVVNPRGVCHDRGTERLGSRPASVYDWETGK